MHAWLLWTDERRSLVLMVREMFVSLTDVLMFLLWQVRQYCVAVEDAFHPGTFRMAWEPWHAEQGGACGLVATFRCTVFAWNWSSLWQELQARLTSSAKACLLSNCDR